MRDRVTREEAAKRVGEYLWEHRGETTDIQTLAKRTRLTVRQVGDAERLLKRLVHEQRDLFGGYVLHVNLGNGSAHGFVQGDDADVVKDAFSRAKYVTGRAWSEVRYLEQALQRHEDREVRKLLRRGAAYARAAAEAHADAYERMTGQEYGG